MKRFFAVLAATILLAGALVPTMYALPVSADVQTDVYGGIESYFDRAIKNAHIPAASVIVVDEDETLLCKQYGKDVTADTPFLLGSVSKSFTAVCVMQLVEEGKIGLDEKISRYLPAARDGDDITVRQLQNQPGGLGVYQTKKTYQVSGKQGTHVYANVNYTLLGEIVEAVSGQSYETYVKERIFTPLRMTHSAATREESEQNGLVQGYQNYFGFSVKSPPRYPKDDGAWITVPAGYLSASAADMGKYLQMYLKGGAGVLTQESINSMFYENVAVKAKIPYSYGFGWTLFEEPFGEPVLRHSGWVETGMTCIYLLPERGIASAFLINVNDFFVTKDMMDRMDWSIPLLLTGKSADEIGKNEFVLKHLGYDSAYFAVLLLSLLPFFFLKRYLKQTHGKRLALQISLLIILHAVCPALMLLLPRIFAGIPLWVVCAFAPDFFLIDILSAVFLFFGGVYKTAFMLCSRKKSRS